MTRIPQLLLGLLAIAVAVVLAGLLGRDAVITAKAAKDTITVTGSARQPIESDLASWTLDVSAQDAAPAAASQQLIALTAKVRSFLASGGLPDGSVSEPPLSTEEIQEINRNGNPTGRVLAYNLTQTFVVESKEIDSVKALAARVSDLLGKGVPVSAYPLEYVSTQLVAAKLQALKRATENARDRARTIVESLGGRLGKVRSAELGVYQVTPRNSTEVSDIGVNDTSSRQKDVTAVVSVTFAVGS